MSVKLQITIVEIVKVVSYSFDIEKASSVKKSQASRQDLQDRVDDQRRSNSSQKSKVKSSNLSVKGSDRSSEASSIASQSVYCVQDDDDDEWATLVKFDTELFKKEKEL